MSLYRENSIHEPKGCTSRPRMMKRTHHPSSKEIVFACLSQSLRTTARIISRYLLATRARAIDPVSRAVSVTRNINPSPLISIYFPLKTHRRRFIESPWKVRCSSVLWRTNRRRRAGFVLACIVSVIDDARDKRFPAERQQSPPVASSRQINNQ